MDFPERCEMPRSTTVFKYISGTCDAEIVQIALELLTCQPSSAGPIHKPAEVRGARVESFYVYWRLA